MLALLSEQNNSKTNTSNNTTATADKMDSPPPLPSFAEYSASHHEFSSFSPAAPPAEQHNMESELDCLPAHHHALSLSLHGNGSGGSGGQAGEGPASFFNLPVNASDLQSLEMDEEGHAVPGNAHRAMSSSVFDELGGESGSDLSSSFHGNGGFGGALGLRDDFQSAMMRGVPMDSKPLPEKRFHAQALLQQQQAQIAQQRRLHLQQEMHSLSRSRNCLSVIPGNGLSAPSYNAPSHYAAQPPQPPRLSSSVMLGGGGSGIGGNVPQSVRPSPYNAHTQHTNANGLSHIPHTTYNASHSGVFRDAILRVTGNTHHYGGVSGMSSVGSSVAGGMAQLGRTPAAYSPHGYPNAHTQHLSHSALSHSTHSLPSSYSSNGSGMGLAAQNMHQGRIYQVQFKCTNRYFTLSSGSGAGNGSGNNTSLTISVGDFVVVEADRGEDVGVVTDVLPMKTFIERRIYCKSATDEEESVIGRILRLASPAERQLLPEKYRDEDAVLTLCRELAYATYRLPMIIQDVDYQYDRHKLTIYYSSETRVDFREFVRDLFSAYKARIWMKKLHAHKPLRVEQWAVMSLATGMQFSPDSAPLC